MHEYLWKIMIYLYVTNIIDLNYSGKLEQNIIVIKELYENYTPCMLQYCDLAMINKTLQFPYKQSE